MFLIFFTGRSFNAANKTSDTGQFWRIGAPNISNTANNCLALAWMGLQDVSCTQPQTKMKVLCEADGS
jgi:hypothetical protein